MPVVNIFYDMLVDHNPPKPSELREALNNIGLLATLFLTIALALPMSISYEELEQTIDRYNCTAPSSIYRGCSPYALKWTGVHIISEMANMGSWAQFWLCTSIFGVVVFLVTMVTTGDEASYNDKAKYLAWWKWTRVVFGSTIFSLIAGFVGTFRSMTFLWMVKFPDPFIMEHGQSRWSLGGESPVGLNSLLITLEWGVLLLVFLIQSAGLWALKSTPFSKDATGTERDANPVQKM